MRVFAFVLVAIAACTPQGSQAEPPAPSKPAPQKPASGNAAERPPLATAAVEIEHPGGPSRFVVELAQSPRERERGLMFREQLSDEQGMLFLFERMQQLSFWMKNTLIPLDMLFIDDQGVIVGIVENAEPQTLTSRKVDGHSRYVLEVNGGLCRRRGIQKGQRVRFEGVVGHPAGLHAPSPTTPAPQKQKPGAAP